MAVVRMRKEVTQCSHQRGVWHGVTLWYTPVPCCHPSTLTSPWTCQKEGRPRHQGRGIKFHVHREHKDFPHLKLTEPGDHIISPKKNSKQEDMKHRALASPTSGISFSSANASFSMCLHTSPRRFQSSPISEKFSFHKY